MYDKLVNKEAQLALVGLGYVGLPLALEFAKKIPVIGFDINEERLAKMRQSYPEITIDLHVPTVL